MSIDPLLFLGQLKDCNVFVPLRDELGISRIPLLAAAAFAFKPDLYNGILQRKEPIPTDVNIATPNTKQTTLHLLTQYGSQDLHPFLLNLLNHPETDIEKRNALGQTPLMTAALGHNAPAFFVLYALQANLDATDDSGKSVQEYVEESQVVATEIIRNLFRDSKNPTPINEPDLLPIIEKEQEKVRVPTPYPFALASTTGLPGIRRPLPGSNKEI